MRNFKFGTTFISYHCDRCKNLIPDLDHVHRVIIRLEKDRNANKAKAYDLCQDCILILENTMGRGRTLIS